MAAWCPGSVASVRVGFLGCGHIATFHSKLLRRSGIEHERAGCYDPDAERARAFARASGHRLASGEDDVLDSCDAVYVTTWTSEHPRLVAAAARRGLAVFCEKPLATDLAGAQAVAAVVRTTGIVNQVGLILRRSPALLWMRHLIEEPDAGPVQAVVLRDDQFLPTQGHYRSTWRADVTRAGAGTLLEHSIHDIDALSWLAGPPRTVNARTSNRHGHPGIEDTASVVFGFDGDALGTLTSVWHDNLARPSLRRLEVFCERRWIVLDGDDWWGPVRWTDASGAEGSLGGDDLAVRTAALAPVHPQPAAAFLTAARDRTPAFPDVEVALAAHRVVDACYRSAAAGGATVTLEP